MSLGSSPYVHASALVVAEFGVLIRGPSKGGKSRLALLLISAAQRRGLFARLVGDDRVALTLEGGRVLARGHPAIAGLIEKRGEGIVRVPYQTSCVLDWVIELTPAPSASLPGAADEHAELLGVGLRRLALPAGLQDVDCEELLAWLRRGPD